MCTRTVQILKSIHMLGKHRVSSRHRRMLKQLKSKNGGSRSSKQARPLQCIGVAGCVLSMLILMLMFIFILRGAEARMYIWSLGTEAVEMSLKLHSE